MLRTYYVRKGSPCYYRCISVAKFIVEDGGHSAREAAEEFRVSETTIRDDLNRLQIIAFSDIHKDNPKKQTFLRLLYVNAKNTLRKRKGQNVTASKVGKTRRTKKHA